MGTGRLSSILALIVILPLAEILDPRIPEPPLIGSSTESAPPALVRDLAVCGLAVNKTVIVTGETVVLAAWVENRGDFEETFTVTAFSNSTRIGTKVVTLFGGGSAVVLFNWGTERLVKGAYVIEAEAEILPGETNTENNRYVAASPARLTFVRADIDGSLSVDILDAAILAQAFGSRGSANWNSVADLNRDLVVNQADVDLWRGNRSDLNRDGRIDCSDELLISFALGSSALAGWNPRADVRDGDGDVDIIDAAFLAFNFGASDP